MNEGEETAPDRSSRLPSLSKWLGVASLALLLYFVVVAFENRNQPLSSVPPGSVAILMMRVSFADSMGRSFANTLGGACGAVFIASSLCTLAALATGTVSLRTTSPPDPRTKIGLSLATVSMFLTAVVAIFMSLAYQATSHMMNFVK